MEIINVEDNNSNSEDNQHESETEVAEQSQKSQKKEKSPSQVWEHFTKDINFKENKKAVCNYGSAHINVLVVELLFYLKIKRNMLSKWEKFKDKDENLKRCLVNSFF